MLRRSILSLLFALAGCAAESPERGAAQPANAEPEGARTWVIRLDRPLRAGDAGYLRVDSDEVRARRLFSSSGERLDGSILHVVAAGNYSVVSATSDGAPLEIEYRVDELTADFGSERPALRLGPTTLGISRAAADAPATLTVDGHPADTTTREVVDRLVPLSSSAAPSDGAVFGSSEPQAVGARWPIRSEVAQAFLNSPPMVVAPNAVSGAVTLLSIEPRGVLGIPAAELLARVEVAPFDLTDLPDGARIERARLTLESRFIVPLADLPRLAEDSVLRSEVALVLRTDERAEIVTTRVTRKSFEPTRPQ
ncbi:MAG: hypothetical protein U0271_00430 [Polyangiaceae bacterium]